MSTPGRYAERRVITRAGRPNPDRARRTIGTIGPEQQTLGKALAVAITAHGHTVEEAARTMGVSRGNIQQWVADLVVPWPENFDALMGYLGVGLDTLGGLVVRTQVRRAELRHPPAFPGPEAQAV
jgi:hypothetical protein